MRQEDNQILARNEKIANLIQKFAPTGAEVLDIGCGCKTLSKFVMNYTGVDIEDYGLKIRHFYKVDLDNEWLLFDAHSFDVIVCSEVLEHLFNIINLLKDMQRILKPEGILIITLPNELTIDRRIKLLFSKTLKIDIDHKWIFTPEQARELIVNNLKMKLIYEDNFFSCSGGRILPISLRNKLANKYPNWFSGSKIMVFKKGR